MSKFLLNDDCQIRALVVDDELSIVSSIADALTAQGYAVSAYTSSREALDNLAENSFDLALVDINMPVVDGEAFARSFVQKNREAEIIIITGVPDEKNIDVFLRQGITHFLFKPFNRSQLIYTVYAALHYQRMRKSMAAASGARQSKLVGISSSIRKLREEIVMVADLDIPVLIIGESGTGKEIVAQEVHNLSQRKEGTFLPINCAVLGTLAESDLFGHAKGAFTGSVSSTSGHVGAAENGTLFLDEVGELSLDIQSKLLRFLDSGEYMRVGESKLRYSNARIVAATNRDLEKMCSDGTFREDLYYRLSAGIIRTDPLSVRKEDIMPLIYHFLSLFGAMQNTTIEIASGAAERLVEQSWPGNVRQLKQTLFRVAQTAQNDRILLQDIEKILGTGGAAHHPIFKEAKQKVIHDFEREYLLRTLQLAQGNLKKALQLSGMHKKNFYTKINNLGLLLKDFHP